MSLLDDPLFEGLRAAQARVARLESILVCVRRALRSGRPNAVAELIDGIDRGHVKFEVDLVPDKGSIRLDPHWPHVRKAAGSDEAADGVVRAMRSGAIPL